MQDIPWIVWTIGGFFLLISTVVMGLIVWSVIRNRTATTPTTPTPGTPAAPGKDWMLGVLIGAAALVFITAFVVVSPLREGVIAYFQFTWKEIGLFFATLAGLLMIGFWLKGRTNRWPWWKTGYTWMALLFVLLITTWLWSKFNQHIFQVTDWIGQHWYWFATAALAFIAIWLFLKIAKWLGAANVAKTITAVAITAAIIAAAVYADKGVTKIVNAPTQSAQVEAIKVPISSEKWTKIESAGGRGFTYCGFDFTSEPGSPAVPPIECVMQRENPEQSGFQRKPVLLQSLADMEALPSASSKDPLWVRVYVAPSEEEALHGNLGVLYANSTEAFQDL